MMKRRTLMAVVCAVAIAVVGRVGVPHAQNAPPASAANAEEEFVGPFPSWTNVRAVYGARGDGTADDTAALQRALTDIGDSESRSPVLYIPAGRYRITSTLTIEARLNVSVLGESTSGVTIVWDGPRDVPMLLVSGVAYSKFSRMTFDGRGQAFAAIDQSWDGKTGAFDTGNEYSDLRLAGVEYGIRGGFKGGGFAETAILRSVFERNTKAGVALGNFNALDIWVVDSLFDHCTVGITNDPGAGNFHVYNSVFLGSALADLVMQNTGGFSARGNYSEGSKAFFISGRPINHPAQVSLQGNTIVDPRDSVSIRISNQGPALIVDNTIRSRPDAQSSPVFWKSPVGADVASVGNTFTVQARPDVNGRLVTLDDRVVAARSLAALTPPRLPGPLPNRGRTVIEVPAGAGAAEIQQAIDRAVALRGRRPVVHLPFGLYRITRTIVVPPSDIQLVGDGYTTVLRWEGDGAGPVLSVTGPSHVTLRELQVNGNATADGIVFSGLDRPNARVHASSLEVRAGRQRSIAIDQTGTATIDFISLGHAYVPETATSFEMRGGRATIHWGASAANGSSYDLSGGASLVARDIWYEGQAPRGFARVHGEGAFTLEASRVASPAGTDTPAFAIEDLVGRFSLITTLFDDRIVVSGAGRGTDVVTLGTMREFHATPVFTDRTQPPATVLRLNARQRLQTQGLLSAGTEAIPDAGNNQPDVLRRALADTRAVLLPSALTPLPADVPDIRLFRVWAADSRTNVLFSGR